jgi:hypothetical protein
LKEIFRYFGTLVAALLAGTIGGVLVLPFGLVLVEFVIWPLTFAIAAIFASVGAGWAGNLLAPGRSRLLPIVGIAEVTGAAVSVLLIVFLLSVRPQSPGEAPTVFVPPIFLLETGVILIALSAAWAVRRFRSPESRLGKDAAITLGLLVVAVLAFFATLLLAGLFGLAGA